MAMAAHRVPPAMRPETALGQIRHFSYPCSAALNFRRLRSEAVQWQVRYRVVLYQKVRKLKLAMAVQVRCWFGLDWGDRWREKNYFEFFNFGGIILRVPASVNPFVPGSSPGQGAR